GLQVAQWLEQRPEVASVLHPALPSHPGHALWKRDFTGACGLFAVILKPCSPASLEATVDTLSLFGLGLSWGGYESLVVPFSPGRTGSPWAGAPALRLHGGLGDPRDLIADLESGCAALAQAQAHGAGA